MHGMSSASCAIAPVRATFPRTVRSPVALGFLLPLRSQRRLGRNDFVVFLVIFAVAIIIVIVIIVIITIMLSLLFLLLLFSLLLQSSLLLILSLFFFST